MLDAFWGADCILRVSGLKLEGQIPFPAKVMARNVDIWVSRGCPGWQLDTRVSKEAFQAPVSLGGAEAGL